MAITTTGAISFSDLRTEFVGGSSAISLGDLYRGGSNILKKAGDNTATNDAASVPTSGAIDMEDFYSTAKSFTKTYSSGATDQTASTIFGDDYDVNYPKNIIINNGVELGASSTSEEALEVPAGGVGTITVTNNGTLSGYGGAAGSVGGDAFESAVDCTFINNGTVRAGGGGGGAGGTGGNGSYTSTSVLSYPLNRWISYQTQGGPLNYYRQLAYVSNSLVYNAYNTYNSSYGSYSRSSYVQISYFNDPEYTVRYFRLASTSTVSTSGGAGGAGGVGQGYNVSAGSGSSGAAGGTNAGTGGAGAAGGSFGNAGGTGSTGTNGNASNCAAGSAGGAAGKYARQTAGTLTFTNNGTVQGNAP